jgi:hypothetical protein
VLAPPYVANAHIGLLDALERVSDAAKPLFTMGSRVSTAMVVGSNSSKRPPPKTAK